MPASIWIHAIGSRLGAADWNMQWYKELLAPKAVRESTAKAGCCCHPSVRASRQRINFSYATNRSYCPKQGPHVGLIRSWAMHMKELKGCCFVREVHGPAWLRVGRHNRNSQKQSAESQEWPKQHFAALCSEKAKTEILGSVLPGEIWWHQYLLLHQYSSQAKCHLQQCVCM